MYYQNIYQFTSSFVKQNKMKKIGLTGGIGAGKTYVSKVFQQMGIPVFNADIEAKNCMAEDKELIQKIKNTFGSTIYKAGELQKKELQL